MAIKRTNLGGVSSGFANYSAAASPLDTGESNYQRLALTNGNPATASNSGQVILDFFTAQKTETITQIRTYTGSAAAAATPTLCRVGVYTIDGSGNLTLATAAANDTTLWAATVTAYTRTLTTSWDKVAGQRYALARIVITAVAMPNFVGPATANTGVIGTIYGQPPRVTGVVNSQTDLPPSITAGSVLTTAAVTYYEMIP